VAKGWGPVTRERQHASRVTIPQRWGENTNPRTQAQLSLNRSALAAARLQLPSLASGVGNSHLQREFICRRTPNSVSQPSDPFLPFRLWSRPQKSKYRLGPRPSGLGSGGETPKINVRLGKKLAQNPHKKKMDYK